MRVSRAAVAAGVVTTMLLSGCGSTMSKDDVKRAVAASFPGCSNWEALPEGQELIPGVGADWAMGCQSTAAVVALEDPAQICDFWARSGDGPERFAVTLDGQVLVLDLSGDGQEGAVAVAAANPDMFAVATVDAFCEEGGWVPADSEEVADAEGEFAKACEAWMTAMQMDAGEDARNAQVASSMERVEAALALNPGKGAYLDFQSAVAEYMTQTVLIQTESPIADGDARAQAVSRATQACGGSLPNGGTQMNPSDDAGAGERAPAGPVAWPSELSTVVFPEADTDQVSALAAAVKRVVTTGQAPAVVSAEFNAILDSAGYEVVQGAVADGEFVFRSPSYDVKVVVFDPELSVVGLTEIEMEARPIGGFGNPAD